MNSSMKKTIILIIIHLFLMHTTGCWSNKDLNKRAFVTGLGLDKTDGNKIELTLQIVKPSVVGAESPKTGEEPVWVHSSKGDTVFEAVRNQIQTVNRKPFYSHVQLIVISEKLAKEGIKDIMDLFERHHETKLTSTIIIAKGTTAKKILTAKSDQESIPAIHIKQILDDYVSNPSIIQTTLFDLLKRSSYPGHNITIGVIEIEDYKKNLSIKDMEVKGAAVFRKDKLIGWLNPIEAKGYQYTQDKIETGIIDVLNPIDKNKKVAIEEVRCNGKIDAQLKETHLKLFVNVKAKGIIGEQQGYGDLTTQEMLEKLEEETENVIEKQISDVVNLAQKKYRSDIFGFGNVVHRKYLDYWNHKKDDWDEIFPSIPVEINVEFKIIRTGNIGQSIKVQ